jgi:hypothetical protein
MGYPPRITPNTASSPALPLARGKKALDALQHDLAGAGAARAGGPAVPALDEVAVLWTVYL